MTEFSPPARFLFSASKHNNHLSSLRFTSLLLLLPLNFVHESAHFILRDSLHSHPFSQPSWGPCSDRARTQSNANSSIHTYIHTYFGMKISTVEDTYSRDKRTERQRVTRPFSAEGGLHYKKTPSLPCCARVPLSLDRTDLNRSLPKFDE